MRDRRPHPKGLPAACLAVALVAPISAAPSMAQSVSQVDLLPGWTEADGTRIAGVQISMAPGWHTYWRQPMGNGIPPQFDWSGSANVQEVHIHWPAPKVFETYGMKSAGYEDRVIFPIEVVPARADTPIRLDLSLFYGVCEDVCIPAEADVVLDLPPSTTGGSAPIRAALQTVTQSAAVAGVTGHRCRIAPAEGGFAITADIMAEQRLPVPEMVIFEAGSDEVWIKPTRWAFGERSATIDAALSYYGSGAFAFDRSAVRITMIGSDRAIELRGCPS